MFLSIEKSLLVRYILCNSVGYSSVSFQPFLLRHLAIPLIRKTKKLWIIIRYWNLPTYPSPKPTLTLTSHLRQNVGLRER